MLPGSGPVYCRSTHKIYAGQSENRLSDVWQRCILTSVEFILYHGGDEIFSAVIQTVKHLDQPFDIQIIPAFEIGEKMVSAGRVKRGRTYEMRCVTEQVAEIGKSVSEQNMRRDVIEYTKLLQQFHRNLVLFGFVK